LSLDKEQECTTENVSQRSIMLGSSRFKEQKKYQKARSAKPNPRQEPGGIEE